MVFYYSPVLTSRAVTDDADTTQGPLGRVLGSQQGHWVPCHPRAEVPQPHDSDMCPLPFTSAHWGEMGEQNLWAFLWKTELGHIRLDEFPL